MAEENRVIEVRRATVDDYQAVLDINKCVYLGLDYIPYQYHELVTDPDFSYYVCLVNGEVGALEGVCLLDENKSLMTRSARVKEKFQGQGLLAHIRRRIFEDYKDVPGEKNLRCSCSNIVRYVHSKTFRSQNKTLLVERIIHFQEFDVGQMDLMHENLDESKSISSMDHFSAFLEIQTVKNYLFPENLITDNSWFFDAVSSNLRHIWKRSPQIIITKHLYKFLPPMENYQTETEVIEPSNVTKGENCVKRCTQGLLAIAGHIFSPVYNLFRINLFGRPTQGKEVEEIISILNHALVCLQKLYSVKGNGQPVVCAIIPHNKDTPREIFYEAAKQLGLFPTTWNTKFTEQYYFEQGFDFLLK